MSTEWKLDGLCRQVDPETWYPEKGGDARPAKQVCRRCPVVAECLADALEHEERFGVWGGLTFRERQAVAVGKRPMPTFPAVAALPAIERTRGAA